MKNLHLSTLSCLCLVAMYSCSQVLPKNLKDSYKDDFLMGTALGTPHILQKDAKADVIIKGQFNAITPENIMKAEVIHPAIDKYNFELSDKYVNYGKDNKMFVVGHTLIWHSQLPSFVSEMTNAEQVKGFMEEHIATVVGRYAGKIDSWDVVNEALNEDGTLRESVFSKTLGEDFIKDAFVLAAKADPKAELYYNDYNIEQAAKRKGAIKLIKKLQSEGVKIDGVGIQGHWSINTLDLAEIEDAIKDYAALGIKIAFTELDLTVLPNPWDLQGADVNQNFEGSEKMNPYTSGLPAEIDQKLANKYEDLFKLFLKYKDNISRVTFWGINDGHSWLNGFPIKGRTNYPLLFDRNYEPKKAYFSVMNLKN